MVYSKVLICILILVFFLRVPSLFEPYWYGDEGIYLVMGQALRRGLVWYKEIHDNKPPPLYLIAAVAGNVFWFRAILLVWMLLTTCLFCHLAEKIFSKNKRAIAISTLLFAIFTSIPFFEGNIANAEIFMIGPIIASMLVLYSGITNDYVKWRGPHLALRQLPTTNFFLAGLLFSLATLFKVPAVFDFLAICVFLLLFSNKNLFSILYSLFSIFLGFLLPILGTIIYYWSKGALFYYFNAAFLQNIGYLSSWGAGRQGGSLLQSGLLFRGVILTFLLVTLYRFRKKFKREILFLFVWFLFSLFAVLLSERPYPHYFIQVLPAISLLLPFLFLGKKVGKLMVLFALFIFHFSFFIFHFYSYPVFSYYQNYILWLSGQKPREEYFANFDKRTPQTYQIADYLVSHTGPEERIFIWGDEPCIYALSRRLPPGRYMVAYHIVDFDGYQETMKALREKNPPFIVKMGAEKRKFPDFEGFLRNYYIKVKAIEDGEIYLRIQ